MSEMYGALVAFIDHELERPARERSLTIEYLSKDQVSAIKDAVRFARGRERNFKSWEFCAIKVHTFHIGPIGKDGNIEHSNGGTFFEWKYDWPGTFEEYLRSFKKEYA